MSYGGGAPQVAITEELRRRTPEAVVAEINAARSRESLRFRLIFGLTWVVLIGLLVGGLIAAGKIDSAFLGEWAPYILGGIPITTYAGSQAGADRGKAPPVHRHYPQRLAHISRAARVGQRVFLIADCLRRLITAICRPLPKRF